MPEHIPVGGEDPCPGDKTQVPSVLQDRDIEAAAFRYVAQQALAGFEFAGMEQFFQDDVNGGRAGVALGIKIGEPAFERNIEPRLEHVLPHLVAEVVR